MIGCLKRALNVMRRHLFVCILVVVIITSVITVLLFRSAQGATCLLTQDKQLTLNTLVQYNALQDQIIIPQIRNETDISKISQKVYRKDFVENHKVMFRNTDVPLLFQFPNYNVHIFYYAWYGTVEVDGKWEHWNHKYLSSWKKGSKVYPTGAHEPPSDIASNFYPKLGCYSSSDPNTIDIHMKQLKDIQVGVMVVSWYPPGKTDSEGVSSDHIFSKLLDSAVKHGIRVAPHIEPYRGRNPINFAEHLRYFVKQYGDHPALYKMKRGKKQLPLYYIYDSYLTPAAAWRELLSSKGNLSIRGTQYDGIFLGLLVEMQHRFEIRRAHFDGFYTYFASNGFTYGSSWKNWRGLSKFALQNRLIFVPSVGPGYIDTQVRPWNGGNTQHRRHGKYYEVAWRSAFQSKAEVISITSFNEWHEGTQIEPAIPKTTSLFTYFDYEPEGPNFYLNLTKFWVNVFTENENRVDDNNINNLKIS